MDREGSNGQVYDCPSLRDRPGSLARGLGFRGLGLKFGV